MTGGYQPRAGKTGIGSADDSEEVGFNFFATGFVLTCIAAVAGCMALWKFFGAAWGWTGFSGASFALAILMYSGWRSERRKAKAKKAKEEEQ